MRTDAIKSLPTLEQHWCELWNFLGFSPPPNLLVELMSSYSESHRFYHTLQHLGECLELLAEAAHLAQRLPEVQLALWFHDAIYDSRRQDNEERSAVWAMESLFNFDQDLAQSVHYLVLATKHSCPISLTADAQLLVDVDLTILGADEERFAAIVSFKEL